MNVKFPIFERYIEIPLAATEKYIKPALEKGMGAKVIKTALGEYTVTTYGPKVVDTIWLEPAGNKTRMTIQREVTINPISGIALMGAAPLLGGWFPPYVEWPKKIAKYVSELKEQSFSGLD
jgi:hypothetical protein